MTILLVEDDEMLGEAIIEGLYPRYVVERCGSLEAAKAALAGGDFQLLILDLALPDGSGFDLLAAERRKRNPLPCLILSAKASLADRLTGLNGGADDYLVKPFELEELIARCEAIIRRAEGRAWPTICHGDLVYDPAARLVVQNDLPVALSARELAIFDVLIKNIGRVVSKAQLEDSIYHWDKGIESNTIEVHISHLRRKIDNEAIKTIRGLGYVMPKIA